MRIQEIAEKAGVSTATVSRVFSHHTNVRAEVREHVLAVARRYGYRPRLSSKQRNIVIITPYKQIYPAQAFVEMVMTELTRELSRHGYRVEILPHDNLERLESIQFCGAVSIGFAPPALEVWDERFAVPLVMVDRRPEEKMPPGVSYVHSDETQAMELAIGHLAEYGCRKIGSIIHGVESLGNAEIRRQGIVRALKIRRLPADRGLMKIALPEMFLEETGKLLHEGIDGLFCCGGDNIGGSVAYALSLYGKNIPRDILLVSSERAQISRFCIPPQTTISPDYPALAKAVAATLTARLRGDADVNRETVIPYKLIMRDSTVRR